MSELEVLLTLIGILLVAGVPIYFLFTPGKKTISRSIQAEIDQTPEWWDNEFRRLQGLPPVLIPKTDIDRWRAAGITEVWGGDLHFSFKHLTDPKPPTVAEIWTPRPGDNYDLSVDLAAMSSSIQEATKGKND